MRPLLPAVALALLAANGTQGQDDARTRDFATPLLPWIPAPLSAAPESCHGRACAVGSLLAQALLEACAACDIVLLPGGVLAPQGLASGGASGRRLAAPGLPKGGLLAPGHVHAVLPAGQALEVRNVSNSSLLASLGAAGRWSGANFLHTSGRLQVLLDPASGGLASARWRPQGGGCYELQLLPAHVLVAGPPSLFADPPAPLAGIAVSGPAGELAELAIQQLREKPQLAWGIVDDEELGRLCGAALQPVVAAPALCPSAFAAAVEPCASFELLHSNNVRGELLPRGRYQPCTPAKAEADPTACLGGAARRAGYIDSVRSQRLGETVVVDPGGHFFGSAFFYEFLGNASGELVRRLGYDAIGLNHRDFVTADAMDIIQNFLKVLNDTVIATNLEVPTIQTSLRPYKVLQLASGHRVGVVSSVPADFLDLCMAENATVVNRRSGASRHQVGLNLDLVSTVLLLRQRLGVGAVVVLTSATGKELDVILQTTPGIDLVLLSKQADVVTALERFYPRSGYRWSDLPEAVGAVESIVEQGRWIPLAALPDYGTHLGHFTLDLRPDGRLGTWSWRQVALDHTVPSNGGIWDRVKELHEAVVASNSRPLALVGAPVEYDEGKCNSGDCPIGRFVADSMLHWCTSGGAACHGALVNNGAAKAGLDVGNFSRLAALQVNPYSDNLVVFAITGRELKQLLEHGATGCGSDSLPQLAGLRVALGLLEVSPDTGRCRPSQARLVAAEVCVDVRAGAECSQWSAIQNGETYRVATLGFLHRGGDGYPLPGTTQLDQSTGGNLVHAMGDYLAAIPASALPLSMGSVIQACTNNTETEGWERGCRIVETSKSPEQGSDSLCGAGLAFSQALGRCYACPPRTHASYDSLACLDCEPGRFSNASGAAFCRPCPPGTAAAAEGAARCRDCEPGSYAEQAGNTACAACERGRSATAVGSTACERCPIGTYQPLENSSECLACNTTFVTPYLGSAAESDCTCDKGQLWSRGSEGEVGTCGPCPSWLLCPGGLEPALQAQGYHAGTPAFRGGQPSFVVACLDGKHCPAGLTLGDCPPQRGTKGCSQCLGWTEEKPDGSCGPCKHSSLLLLALLLAAGLLLLLIFVCVATRGLRHQSSALFRAEQSVLQSISCIQSLGAFDQIAVDWIDPVRGVIRLASIFVLRIDIFNLGCVVGTMGPVSKYLVIVLAYPVLAALVAVSFGAARALGRQVAPDAAWNAQGMVMMALFLPLAYAVVVPWQCRNNPDGSSAITTERSVICWRAGDHATMLGLSVAGFLLYINSFLALVVWAVFSYPARIASEHGSRFVRRYAFLFGRFRRQCYYWGLVFLLRHLSIAVVLAFLTNTPAVQVLLIIIIIVATLVLQCQLRPWGTDSANALDTGFSVLQAVVLMVALLLLDGRKADDTNAVQGVILAILVAIFGGAALLALHSAWRVLFPGKAFGIFLSHHKGASQALARWLKQQLSDCILNGIFLDSDELDTLPLLLEVVGHNTQNLVVLLSKETLSRMWCACEMAIAHQCAVNLVPVVCGDYEPPSDDFLSKLPELWSATQLAEMQSMGVTLAHVDTAYRCLRELPALQLDREVPRAEQEGLVDQLLDRCEGLTWRLGSLAQSHLDSVASSLSKRAGRTISSSSSGSMRRPTRDSVQASRVLVAGHLGEPEGACTCWVLQRLLQEEIGVGVATVEDQQGVACVGDSDGRSLVAVLRRGSLAEPAFAGVLVACMRAGFHMLPVVADSSFAFPTEAFFEQLGRGDLLSPQALEAHGTHPAEVLAAYKMLLSSISVRFTEFGSLQIQCAEVAAMARRLRGHSKPTLSRQGTAAAGQAAPLTMPTAATELEEEEVFTI